MSFISNNQNLILAIVFLLFVALVISAQAPERISAAEQISGEEKIAPFPAYRSLVVKFYNKCIEFFQSKGYEYSREIPERMSVYYFIDENDKVLEIGGNIGGVSEVIASTLNNPKNLVVMEPSDDVVGKLRQISVKSNNFNVHHGVLTYGNKNYECKHMHSDTSFFACNEVDYPVKNNITFDELQNTYNIQFNTLVIDCEGCYESLFRYGFESGMLKNIKKIFIEWDGEFMEDMFLKNGFILLAAFPHEDLVKGNRVYIKRE